MLGALALAALGCPLVQAETVDRVVASVGHQAVTASDVEKEYRLELFLEGNPPSDAEPGLGALDQVRGRVIDRVLLEDEVQANGIQIAVGDESVVQRLHALRDKFPAAQAYEEGLNAVGISEEDLRVHFAKQAEVLLLIDRRLRPEATVETPEIEAYYRNILIPDLARQGEKQPPALDDVEDRIREILVQKKINALLEAWLERLRAARDVKLYGSAEAENKS
jgi:hypothetical protein